jgi:hypothetical protein
MKDLNKCGHLVGAAAEPLLIQRVGHSFLQVLASTEAYRRAEARAASLLLGLPRSSRYEQKPGEIASECASATRIPLVWAGFVGSPACTLVVQAGAPFPGGVTWWAVATAARARTASATKTATSRAFRISSSSWSRAKHNPRTRDGHLWLRRL